MEVLKDSQRIECDVLIIGGGGTGLSAAITAKRLGADVVVASKAKVGYANNTYISAGIIASPGRGDANDSSEVHLKDIMIGGRFINDPVLSGLVAQQAKEHVPFLEECGVNFTQKDGSVEAVLFPGHSLPRNVQAITKRGNGYMLPLVKYAKNIGVRFLNNTFITRLFVQDNNITAAMGFNAEGTLFKIDAKSVILATGGFAQIYKNNNNAFGITGDGHALAYDLGVPFRDMEFVQFYPTWGTFYEFTVAMAGARLKNSKGEDILEKHGLLDSSAVTRDQLSIAVFSEIQQGLDVDGGVVVDFESVSEDSMELLLSFLPNALNGMDQGQVVTPTAHFCMGGVMVNEKGMTTVDGLFAAGEICGGVHGANRLGGNALAEVFSMGRITGRSASEYSQQNDHIRKDEVLFKEEIGFLESVFGRQGEDIKQLTSSFKKAIWENAGIIRNRDSLENALSTIKEIELDLHKVSIHKIRELRRFLELRSMLTVSKIVCHSALLRKESRGSHYRSDFPDEDNHHWLKNIIARKVNGDIKTEILPIEKEVLRKLNLEFNASNKD
jgi:succinate dehydrogenase/fumarate reductase flavoprotein subunit